MTSTQVAAKAIKGTVVAAECCYGAQLYDPALADVDGPICMAYLGGGALAFMGSTNIAYGPSDSNGQADLITQYFMQHVTSGVSLGRGFLQARQRFHQLEDDGPDESENARAIHLARRSIDNPMHGPEALFGYPGQGSADSGV